MGRELRGSGSQQSSSTIEDYRYVNRVGQKGVASDAKVPVTINVIDSASPFACGGFFYAIKVCCGGIRSRSRGAMAMTSDTWPRVTQFEISQGHPAWNIWQWCFDFLGGFRNDLSTPRGSDVRDLHEVCRSAEEKLLGLGQYVWAAGYDPLRGDDFESWNETQKSGLMRKLFDAPCATRSTRFGAELSGALSRT